MEQSHSSEISPHFMESEGSVQFSQHPATCSYPDPDESSPHIPVFFSDSVTFYTAIYT